VNIENVWVSKITPNSLRYGNSFEFTTNEPGYKVAAGRVFTLYGMASFWTSTCDRYSKGNKHFTSIDMTSGGTRYNITLRAYLGTQRAAVLAVRKAVKQVLEGATKG
jgi:hypothetical protein